MLHETHNLAGYLEGTLEPRAAARVERHLEACAHCRAALGDMRAAKRVLTAAGESVKPIHYDAELWSRVHARIATPHRRAPIRPRWALAGGGLALSAAAICLAVLMNTPHPDHHPPAGPTLTAVPPGPQKHTMVAKALPHTHATPPRSGEEFGLSEAPPVEKPPNPATAPGGPPMPETAPPPSTTSLTKREKELVANANTSQVNVPFGATGNSQRNTWSMGGSESNNGNRASYALKDASRIDAQNVPSATRQVTAPVDNSAALDKIAGSRNAAPPTNLGATAKQGETLDIVSGAAPPLPRTVGLAAPPTEQGWIVKAKPPQPPPAPSMGLLPLNGNVIARVGASSVEGHRLYAEADDAYRAGKDSTARLYYSDAITHGLDSYERRTSEVRLGDLAMKSNEAVTAVKWYRAAASRGKDAEVMSKLGDALEKSGDAKGAAASYRQALALNPSYDSAKEGLDRVKGN